MEIQQIEQLWAEDCEIDSLDLDKATRDSYTLHNKYWKILNAARRQLSNLEAKRSRWVLLKTDYYMQNTDFETLKAHGWKPNPRTILKADLPMFITADAEVQQITLEIAEMQQIINFVESIISMINKRNYHINNIIEYRKFQNGGR